MKMNGIVIFLFIFMIMQSIGTILQIKLYKNAVRRLHKKSNIGIGSKKNIFSRNIVIIACDNQCKITGGQILDGITIFSRFKDIPNIIGKDIYELKSIYDSLSQKKKKRLEGHIQALNTLCDYMKRKTGTDN